MKKDGERTRERGNLSEREREGGRDRQRYLADTIQLVEIIWLISNSTNCFKFDFMF